MLLIIFRMQEPIDFSMLNIYLASYLLSFQVDKTTLPVVSYVLLILHMISVASMISALADLLLA